MRIAVVTVWIAAATLLGAANASAQAPPPPAVSQPAAAAPPAPAPEYVLRAGDEITIKVFEQPDLLENVTVRPDGRISIVLLDDLQAAGLTAAALDAAITAGYSKYYTNPQVSVIVRRFVNQRVFIGGEVGQPGTVPLLGEMRAIEAVMQAGGFKRQARLDSVILIRNDGHDKPVVQKLNFKETLSKGTDIPLKPFDVLYVPISRIGKVDKFIDEYIRQLIPVTLTGGFSYIMGSSAVVIPK